MRAIERAWPTGEWVTESAPASAESGGEVAVEKALGSAVEVRPPSLTIIGGTKYDEDEFWNFLVEQGSLYTDDPPALVVGDGRGVESELVKSTAWGERDIKIAPDPDRYGKLARKVNVEQVLCVDPNGPLLLVGTGERVKQAREWLKRTGSKREVIELP